MCPGCVFIVVYKRTRVASRRVSRLASRVPGHRRVRVTDTVHRPGSKSRLSAWPGARPASVLRQRPRQLSTMTRPLTPRHPEPLFLHAPRPGPQARWFRRPLASQAMWLYVLCLCVRHGPPTSQVRGLHGFRPGVDPGHGVYDPCL